MSPKPPIRPATSGASQPATPATRPPDTRPPDTSPAIPSRLPGSTTPVLPGGTGHIPASTLATIPATQAPGPATLVISRLSSATTDSLPVGRPLSAYARPTPKNLPPADSDGFRLVQQRRFVNLEDGQVVMVRYDESVRSYCALTREEHRPSGPALYRVGSSDIWKENRAASTLRQYQLPVTRSAEPESARGTAASGHTDESANDQALLQCRARLLADAEVFFKDYTLPERPRLPELKPEMGERALIETLCRDSDGVVIGENHADSGGKLFLVSNMATLAEHGVRTLYLERLRTDVEQVHLDMFHDTGTLSPALDRYLRTLDGDYGDASPGTCSYRQLILTARAHGVRVQALDCAASDSLRVRDPDLLARASALGYHAHQVIQAAQPAGQQGKWLALVNVHHANGFAPKAAPGLSWLQGVMGVEVEDAMSGPAIRVAPARKHKADDPMRLVGADLKLAVKVSWQQAFELPLQYRTTLQDRIRSPEEIVRRTHVRLNERATGETAISDYLQRVGSLNDASTTFFSGYNGNRRAKAQIPTLPADSTAPRIFETLYENNNGLVLAAEQGSLTARKLVLDHMQTLATLKVETLYVQNLLSDLDQPFIDSFQATGIMPKRFERTLVAEDLHQALGLTSEYSLQRLLVSAREHGIRIQALDMAASYRKQQHKHNVPAFNYIAHKIIDGDQHHQGTHKWLALVLDVHAGNVRGVPGLGQLQGAPSLRTVAIGPLAAPKVSPDSGSVERFYGREEYVRADLTLEVNTPSAPRQQVAQNIRHCLSVREVEPSFLIERQGDNFIVVQRSYRMDADHYEETLIEIHDGKYSLPQGSTLFNGVRYHSLADLAWGLRGEGRVQVADVPGVIPIPATPRLDTHPQLNRPGMFLIDEVANGPVLINRSRDRSLSVTPIRRDPAGKWYINHSRWGYDESRHFDSLDELSRDLIQHVNLSAYSASSDL